MTGSAVDSYRIAPQEQPPLKGIFIVSLISDFVSDVRRMKHVIQDNFLSDGTTDLSFSRSQEQTAVDFEGLAGNPSPVVRGQERDCIGDVGWTASAPERCHSRNTLDRF